MRSKSPRRAYKSGTVTLTVDYGYDVHSIILSGRTWGRILAGVPVRINGQGFSWEGEPDRDYWLFNVDEPGSLRVETYGGGHIYKGCIDEMNVVLDEVEILRLEPVPEG